MRAVRKFCKDVRISLSKLCVGNSQNNNREGEDPIRERRGSELKESGLDDGLGLVDGGREGST